MPRREASVVQRATPGNGRNVWSHEQRLCLWFLNQEHSLTLQERAKVFNTIHQAELASYGIPRGLNASAISAQYYEHRKENSSPWQAVKRPPLSLNERQLREEIRAKITAALAASNDSITVSSGSEQPPRPPQTPPKTPPVPSIASDSRKRTSSNMRTPLQQSDSDDDDQPIERPRKTARVATLVIPVTPETAQRSSVAPAQMSLTRFKFSQGHAGQDFQTTTSPRTSSQSSARKQGQPRPGATKQLHRAGGPIVFLKDHEYAETLPDLVDVVEELGKPHLPPLLFRYFDENSHGINTPDLPQGFISGRFKDARVPARTAPACNELEWNDLCWHLDHASHPSPFLSTSNLFVWVVSKALKLAKKGARVGRISVIDTRYLSRSSVYWVPPFHESLSKKKVFLKGAFNYKGTHEHLVWHEIPGHAVLKTFSLADIFALQAQDAAVTSFLRLATVGLGQHKRVSYRTMLKRDEVPLKGNITTIAKVVEFMGFNQKSDARHLTYAVYECIKGWELHIKDCNEGERLEEAAVFAHYFCRKSEEPLGISELAGLKAAWLYGTRWSMSKVHNIRYRPDAIDKMLLTAGKKKLGDPTSIVMNELGAAMGVVQLIGDGDAQDLKLVRGLQPLMVLQTTARRQAVLEYDPETASPGTIARMLQSQQPIPAPTPTSSRRRANVREIEPEQFVTSLLRTTVSRAQQLLADEVDEDDEDYLQPSPSRQRANVRQAEYDSPASPQRRARSTQAVTAGNDEDEVHDEDFVESGPSRQRPNAPSRGEVEEITYGDDSGDDYW